MPKVTNRGKYDLRKPFEDYKGNRYSRKAVDSLVLWLEMKTNVPVDKSSNSLTVAYESSPTGGVLKELTSGGTLRNTVTFNDSDGKNAKVTANAVLSHSTLADGGTPAAGTDKAFSVSCWVNMDDVSTGANHYLFNKDGGSGSDQEYWARITSTGIILFSISDEVASALEQAQTANMTSLIEGKWAHIVCTYDGRGGASANSGMKIYVNGSSQTLSLADSGTYVGIQPDHDSPLYVGAQFDGTKELDGQMAEFAMWTGHVLTSEEALAIYYKTRLDRGKSSGVISNPVRTILQDNDNRTGSYPTNLRTGDKDFKGNKPGFFDDLKTVNFLSP